MEFSPPVMLLNECGQRDTQCQTRAATSLRTGLPIPPDADVFYLTEEDWEAMRRLVHANRQAMLCVLNRTRRVGNYTRKPCESIFHVTLR